LSGVKIKLAVLGCGAVAEHRHLPALAQRDDCEVVALVDNNHDRAKRLASRMAGAPMILSDYRDLQDFDLTAAIVALPNHLHAPATIWLLEAGRHVLVEKPMALTVADCDAMVRAAEIGKVILAVGMTRRFVNAGRFVRWAIEAGLLGRVLSFDVRDGYVFNWPLASDFFFRKETAGGGVLIDAGVHTLEQILWWLGDIESLEYYDDNAGGVESDCEIHIVLKSGAQGIIELSRTRNLRNTAIIRGERAEIEVGLINNTLRLTFTGSPYDVVGEGRVLHSVTDGRQSQIDQIRAEHDDFFEAIRTRRAPEVSGQAAMRCIEWIQRCYAERRELRLPWTIVPTIDRALQ